MDVGDKVVITKKNFVRLFNANIYEEIQRINVTTQFQQIYVESCYKLICVYIKYYNTDKS